jgi:opacity protein-like surface antigen
MKTHFLAALALAFSSSVAVAQNITEKAMKDHPGHTGSGVTSEATAKPNSGSLSEKAMQAQPGVNGDRGGQTANPTAKPDDGSLARKAMKDQLKN